MSFPNLEPSFTQRWLSKSWKNCPPRIFPPTFAYGRNIPRRRTIIGYAISWTCRITWLYLSQRMILKRWTKFGSFAATPWIKLWLLTWTLTICQLARWAQRDFGRTDWRWARSAGSTAASRCLGSGWANCGSPDKSLSSISSTRILYVQWHRQFSRQEKQRQANREESGAISPR